MSKRYFGSIRQLPSGRYQVRYKGPDGRLYSGADQSGSSLTFDTKQSADAYLARMRTEIQAGTWVSPKLVKLDTMSFMEYAEGWLTDRDLTARTRRHYRTLLDKHILPTFGSYFLGEIRPVMVRTWFARMGKLKTPTARAHAYSLLSAIMNSAIREELISASPCRVRGGSSRRAVKQIKPASVDELITIANAMPKPYQLIPLLAAWCGLRSGEITELRRKDVDLRNGVLRVQRGVTWLPGESNIDKPKTDASVRSIAIPPHLMPELTKHLAERVRPERDALLFKASRSGGNIRPSSLHAMFSRARKTAKRDDLRFHDLRHTGAVLAAATGATLKELMARLGHTTPQMAMRYQHAAADRDKAIAVALSKLANPSDSS